MSSSEGRPSLPRNLGAVLLFAALVLAALLLYGDLQTFGQGLARYDYRYFALALLLASSNYVLRFVRWQYFLSVSEISLPRLESALVFASGFVMSVTPGKLGEVFKSLLLSQSRGVPIARSAPIVLAERLTDLVALVMLTAVGSLAFEQGVLVAVAGASVTVTIWILCVFDPAANVLVGLVGRIRRLETIAERIKESRRSLRELLALPRLAYGSFLALLSWSLECVAMWWIVRGFEEVSTTSSLGPLEATFAYAGPTVAGAVALVPGGLGVTEAGMTATLRTLGGVAMTPAVASATTLLIRLATLWWAVLVGLVAFALWKRIAPQQVQSADALPISSHD